MPQNIREVMTENPVTLAPTTTLDDAARHMRDEAIGDVLVGDGGELRGLVTDRDIVVRAVAEGLDVTTATLGDVCSADLVTISPSDSVEDAVRVMTEHAVRRVPVVEDDQAIGIVALGDLAVEREPDSALGDISAADPNS